MLKEFEEVLKYAKAREKKEGLEWYAIANKRVHDIAIRFDLAPEKVAAIIAVLSPSVEWNGNVEDAENFIRSKGRARMRTYGANVRTARRILKSKSLSEILSIIENLQGFKVKSFFDNLINPLTSTFITVDTHLVRAWHGSPFLTKKQVAAGFRRVLYSEISADILTLAVRHQIRPLEMQAILWVTWKKIAPFKKSAIVTGQSYFESLI